MSRSHCVIVKLSENEHRTLVDFADRTAYMLVPIKDKTVENQAFSKARTLEKKRSITKS